MTVSKSSKRPAKRAKQAAPASLADLQEDPRNPRVITPEAAKGLDVSLKEFGDLSGITFNVRTGHLVAGHQRVKRLREQFGDLAIDAATQSITTPSGDRFAIRIVDWPLSKQRAANIAANATTIQGTFNAELELLLNETQQDSGDLYAALMLDQMRAAPAKTPPERAPVVVPPVYQIIVECENEAEQKAVYTHLKSRGHKCRVSTL